MNRIPYLILSELPQEKGLLDHLITEMCLEQTAFVLVNSFSGVQDQLQDVVDRFVSDGNGLDAFEACKITHFQLAQKLCENHQKLLSDINDLCVEAEWLLEDTVQDSVDYISNQVLAIGPLLATQILHVYLQERGMKLILLDSRDVIKTDENYQSPNIALERSRATILNLLTTKDKYLMASKVGSSDDNNNTYLSHLNWEDLFC